MQLLLFMKFLLVLVLLTQNVHGSVLEFNKHLNLLKSKLEVISLNPKSLKDFEIDLRKDFKFMSSKPYWQKFNGESNENHFVAWLMEKTPFKPIRKSVSRYARPDSQKTFDKGNKKNTSNLESNRNQTKIKRAFKKYSHPLQEIESKYIFQCN